MARTKTTKKKKTPKKARSAGATKGLAKSFAKKLGVSTSVKAEKDPKTGLVIGVVPKKAPQQQQHVSRRTRRRQRRLAKKQQQRRHSNNEEEHLEFQRQQESLWEREGVLQQQQQQQQQAMSIALQPASFATEKSTTQLVQEATQQVQSLGVVQVVQVGGGSNENFGAAAAAAKLQNNSSAGYNTAAPLHSLTIPSISTTSNNNPWTVLRSTNNDQEAKDSDDSDYDNNNNNGRNANLFHFAPASFSVPPAKPPASSSCLVMEQEPKNKVDVLYDDDPDL